MASRAAELQGRSISDFLGTASLKDAGRTIGSMKFEYCVFEFHGKSAGMPAMLERDVLESAVRTALRRSRGVVRRGPWRSGKNTLALEQLQSLVVIDEVQLRPGLFPLLRALMVHQLQPWHENLGKCQAPTYRAGIRCGAARLQSCALGCIGGAVIRTQCRRARTPPHRRCN